MTSLFARVGRWVLCASVMAVMAGESRVIHVKAGADEAGELLGEDWMRATYLRRALEIAEAGDEVWMQAGRYSTLEGFMQIPARCSSFSLGKGVSLLGGFLGTEVALSERRLREESQTVITGDLWGDDVVDEAGVTQGPAGLVGENTNLLLRIFGGDSATILDGVTLTGMAMESRSFCGEDSALSVFGGNPVIRNCRFVGNYGNYGAAILLEDAEGTVVVNCFFNRNEACESGGAIFVDSTAVLILNSTFYENEVDGDGDTISFSQSGSGTVANCILWNDHLESGRRPGTVLPGQGLLPVLVGNVMQGFRDTGWGGHRPVLEGIGIVEEAPRFIAGSFRLRADSPALEIGRLGFLPMDRSDLDGDGDVEELLPFDLAGLGYRFNLQGACDAGCFQYDWSGADSDLDGLSDLFERQVGGGPLSVDPPRILEVRVGEGIEVESSIPRSLLRASRVSVEASESLAGPWVVVVSERLRSALSGDEVRETRLIMPEADQRFFRLRTRARD